MIYHESIREREALGLGSTPVVKRGHAQTQLNMSTSEMSKEERMKLVTPNDPSVTPHMVTFAQDLVTGDLSEQMFRYDIISSQWYKNLSRNVVKKKYCY